MGCGCVSQHQAAQYVTGPRPFLLHPTDDEFVRSLSSEEQKDKRLLLTYKHLHNEGQFEVTPELLDLVRTRGVPKRYRWQVWRTIIGWSSLYKPVAYQKFVRQRADPKTVDAIEKDLDRTFPNIEHFGDAQKRELARILKAFANLCPQVGYCQGMNFVAGFILLSEPEGKPEDAFFMLVQIMIMHKYRGSLLFCDGLPLLKLFTFQFSKLLERLFPEVHRHFVRENITPELYVTKWFLTVFTQPLPFDAVTRLWDLIVCDGLQTLVHLALASVKLLTTRLLRQSTEGILELLSLRGDAGGLPSGGSLVRAALRLKLGGPCGPGLDAWLSKLQSEWTRECPEDAAELERLRLELCSAARSSSALPPVGVGGQAGVGSVRSRVAARSRGAGDGGDSPLLRLPPAAEAALVAAGAEAEAFGAAVSSSSDEEEDRRRRGREAAQGEDPVVSRSWEGAASSAIALDVSSSPHVVAAEAKVEVNASMPSRRGASRTYKPTAMPSSPGNRGRTTSLTVSQDAAATERAPMVQQLPRLSVASNTSANGRRRPSTASDPGTAATAIGAGNSPPAGAAAASGPSKAAGRAGQPWLPAAAMPGEEKGGPQSQLLGNSEALSVSSGLSGEGSPPARQPDIGGLKVLADSLSSRQQLRPSGAAPTREDPSKVGSLPALGRGTSRMHIPSVALDGLLGKVDNFANSDLAPSKLGRTWPMRSFTEDGGMFSRKEAPRVGGVAPATARTPSLPRGGSNASRGSSTERESDAYLASGTNASTGPVNEASRARSLSPQCHMTVSPRSGLATAGSPSPPRPTAVRRAAAPGTVPGQARAPLIGQRSRGASGGVAAAAAAAATAPAGQRTNSPGRAALPTIPAARARLEVATDPVRTSSGELSPTTGTGPPSPGGLREAWGTTNDAWASPRSPNESEGGSNEDSTSSRQGTPPQGPDDGTVDADECARRLTNDASAPTLPSYALLQETPQAGTKTPATPPQSRTQAPRRRVKREVSGPRRADR